MGKNDKKKIREGEMMERVERMIYKLIWIHLVLLIVAQLLLSIDSIHAYLNKTTLYEGITKNMQVKTIETFMDGQK